MSDSIAIFLSERVKSDPTSEMAKETFVQRLRRLLQEGKAERRELLNVLQESDAEEGCQRITPLRTGKWIQCFKGLRFVIRKIT